MMSIKKVKIRLHQERVYLTKACTVTKEDYILSLHFQKYVDWKTFGRPLEKVFGFLPEEDRQFIKTGLTPEEQKLLIKN